MTGLRLGLREFAAGAGALDTWRIFGAGRAQGTSSSSAGGGAVSVGGRGTAAGIVRGLWLNPKDFLGWAKGLKAAGGACAEERVLPGEGFGARAGGAWSSAGPVVDEARSPEDFTS